MKMKSVRMLFKKNAVRLRFSVNQFQNLHHTQSAITYINNVIHLLTEFELIIEYRYSSGAVNYGASAFSI